MRIKENHYLCKFKCNDMSNNSVFDSRQKIQLFFTEQRGRVMRLLGSRYGVNDDDAEEAYSRGVHALLEAIHSGRFTTEYHEHALAHYLQTCCINQLMKMFEQRKKETPIDWSGDVGGDDDSWDDGSDHQPDDAQAASMASDAAECEAADQHEADLQLMESILETLPYPCKDLIWGKLKEGFSAGEMAARLGYSNSRVAITTLSRCMQKLKERFNDERRLIDE